MASRQPFRGLRNTTDLLANGKIEDPFYRSGNEHKLQWIDKVNWEYKDYI